VVVSANPVANRDAAVRRQYDSGVAHWDNPYICQIVGFVKGLPPGAILSSPFPG